MVKKKKGAGYFRLLYKTFFDVPSWLGLNQFKETNKTLGGYLKESYTVKQATRRETFEEAIRRMRVSPAALSSIVKNNTRNYYVMLVFALLLLVYAGYLMFSGHWGAVLLDLVVIGFVLVRAFQFSFWNFQIKQQRLGCTFKEWLYRSC